MHRKKPPTEKNKIQVTLYTQKKDITGELDLHGYTVEEGIAVVEQYLDKAYIYEISPVRLVHGHGTGKLRKAIREYLTNHPHVAKFGPASPQGGGDGATLVYLEINPVEG